MAAIGLQGLAELRRQNRVELVRRYRLATDPAYRERHEQARQLLAEGRRRVAERLEAARALGWKVGDQARLAEGDHAGAVGTIVGLQETGMGQLLARLELASKPRTTPPRAMPPWARRRVGEPPQGVVQLAPIRRQLVVDVTQLIPPEGPADEG